LGVVGGGGGGFFVGLCTPLWLFFQTYFVNRLCDEKVRPPPPPPPRPLHPKKKKKKKKGGKPVLGNPEDGAAPFENGASEPSGEKKKSRGTTTKRSAGEGAMAINPHSIKKGGKRPGRPTGAGGEKKDNLHGQTHGEEKDSCERRVPATEKTLSPEREEGGTGRLLNGGVTLGGGREADVSTARQLKKKRKGKE